MKERPADAGGLSLSLTEMLRAFPISVAGDGGHLLCRTGRAKATRAHQAPLSATPARLYPQPFCTILGEQPGLWGVWRDHKPLCNTLSCTVPQVLCEEKRVRWRSSPPLPPQHIRAYRTASGRCSEREREREPLPAAGGRQHLYRDSRSCT